MSEFHGIPLLFIRNPDQYVGTDLWKLLCEAHEQGYQYGLHDRPTGRWQWKFFGMAQQLVCTNCNTPTFFDDRFNRMFTSDYCPHCGAYMRNSPHEP